MQKQRQGYWLGDLVNTVGGWLGTAAEKATEYAPLLKTGVAALSTYASWKDQQKKNQMQQDVYDDFMAQAQAAGHEAQAAVDLNLTPMTVSNVPTSKADVTDFTAVAARGGLMSVPNKQRKRYYAGTGEEEVIETEDEVLSPFDLQQETGIDLMDEQVKYNTGNPREGAWSVWNSGGINQEIYDFDFEIFFDSGDWTDMLQGQAPVQENMQMASDPSWEAEWDDTYENYKAKQIELGQEFVSKEEFMMDYQDNMAIGGIAGLRHGGRPGYAEDGFVTADAQEVISEVPPSRKTQIEGNQLAEDAYNEIFRKFYERFPGIEEEVSIEDMIAMLQAEGVMETEDLGILGLDRSMDMITPQSVRSDIPGVTRAMAHGGRPGYSIGPGPVMDQETTAQSITLPDGGEEVVTDSMTDIKGQTAGSDIYIIRIDHLLFNFPDLSEEEAEEIAYDDEKYYEKIGHDPYVKGGRVKRNTGGSADDKLMARVQELQDEGLDFAAAMAQAMKELSSGKAQGGRIGHAQGSGIMDLGGMEKDYRTTGGFVPIGAYEKKDDVPARLSKNEFVMTADAVRAAGGGSINKGAQRMYDTMKHLEASPQSNRMIS